MGRLWRSSETHARKSLDHLEEIVGRSMNDKGDSGEVSDGNEEHVIENWGKVDPCYEVPKNLVELCFSVLWKVNFVIK